MALNIVTDKKFDKALAYLAKRKNQTKSDIIRELVLEKCKKMQNGFQRGALAHLFPPGQKPTTEQILKELKELDADNDLDRLKF